MDRITTTIKREFLSDIVAGRKKIEYRNVKPYWTKRLASVSARFQLHLGQILKVKHWNRRTEMQS